jgi:hypothetical protein
MDECCKNCKHWPDCEKTEKIFEGQDYKPGVDMLKSDDIKNPDYVCDKFEPKE